MQFQVRPVMKTGFTHHTGDDLKQQDVSCVILIGGESRRMGADKAFVKLAGQTLLQRVFNCVKPLFDDVMISGRWPRLEMSGTRFISDQLPGRGPAIGLCAALANARHPYVFATACDMPFITSELIERLLSCRHGYDVVAPMMDGKLQPLCAVYSRNCGPALTRRVQRGERSIAGFIEREPGLRVRRIDGRSLCQTAADSHCLMDIDSPENLAMATRVLASSP